MTPADRISRWLAELRASSLASVLARSAIGLAGVVALALPGLQSWDQMDVIPLVGAPMLLVCLVLPDSLAALLFLVIVALGWLLRAPSEISSTLVITGIALLVVHLASAFAAQIPSYAVLHRRALHRWLLPATVTVLLGPVVAVAASLVRGAAVPGSLLVTVAALAAATAAVWFASGQSVSRD